MACQAAGAAVSVGADREPDAVRRQRDRAGRVARSLTVDVASELGPRPADPLEHPDVACEAATTVVSECADREPGAVRRQRDRAAGRVARSLTVDVASELGPPGFRHTSRCERLATHGGQIQRARLRPQGHRCSVLRPSQDPVDRRRGFLMMNHLTAGHAWCEPEQRADEHDARGH